MDNVSATLAASELSLNKFHTSNTSAPPRPSILVFERSSDNVSATLAASELSLNKFHTSNTSAPPRPSILVFERSSTAHGPVKKLRRAPPRGPQTLQPRRDPLYSCSNVLRPRTGPPKNSDEHRRAAEFLTRGALPMNAQQALEYSMQPFIPMFIYGDYDAMESERKRGEEAMKSPLYEWRTHEEPGFDFVVILTRADQNRELCDQIGEARLRNLSSPLLARNLTDADLCAGIGKRRHGIRAPARRGGHEGAARRMAHKRGARLRFRRHPHAGRSEPRAVRSDRRGASAQPLEPVARAQPNGRRPVRRYRQDAGPCRQRRCSRGPR